MMEIENDETTEKVMIRVRQMGADEWIAELSEGWWVARGSNKENAIKAVIKRYQDEAEKY